MPIRISSERPQVDVSDAATPGGRCPADGEPLFAWIEVDGGVLDRCESCGLVLERTDGGEGLAALIESLALEVAERGEAELVSPNAASYQAGIGAESWSALRPAEEPYVLTPGALELLAGHESLTAAEIHYPARTGMAAMLQTILNLLTFNRNFASSVAGGELRPRDSRHGAAGFAIDALVTVFTAIPVAALAVLLEGVGVLAKRGGVIRARLVAGR